jgi:predicted RecB family nuclease
MGTRVNSEPVTATHVYNLIACPNRVRMDRFGDPSKRDEISPFVEMLWERGTRYEHQVVDGLKVSFTDLTGLKPNDRAAATLAAMRRGDGLIFGARIQADDLLGMPDLLRREGDRYVPGDIKSGAGEEDSAGGDSRPKLHYAVQLALYADILERMRIGAGHRGFIWDVHGEEVAYDLDAPQGPRKSRTLWEEYEALRDQTRQILAGDLETRPANAATCKLCHWRSSCLAQLIANDDLTLIPELGRKVRDAMMNRIGTVAELAAIDPDAYITGKKTVFRGVGSDSLRKYRARAEMLSTPGAGPKLTAPITLRQAARELFFDVEVDPLRDLCYLHGVFAETETPEAERHAFREAFGYLSADPDAVIYYWSKYERTAYRKLQAKYPDICTAAGIEALFEPRRAIDLLYDVVTKATEWPTYDRSIKTIAKFLKFDWRDKNPSGAASIQWFDEWATTRDAAIKQRILDYNEDDCRATRVVLDGIRALAS